MHQKLFRNDEPFRPFSPVHATFFTESIIIRHIIKYRGPKMITTMLPLLGLLCFFMPNTAMATVKIFIIAGQSNAAGHAHAEHLMELIATGSPEWAPYWDYDIGDFATRDDVFVNQNGIQVGNLTINNFGDTPPAGVVYFGPEVGFGWYMGDYYQEPVLIIKSDWGGISLAADFRPPSSGGTTGWLWNDMTITVQNTVTNLGKYVPGYNVSEGYEFVGFVWFHGEADAYNPVWLAEYQTNLVNLIHDVRHYLNVPNLPFLIGEMGGEGAYPDEPEIQMREIQRTVAESVNNTIFSPTAVFVDFNTTQIFEPDYHYYGRADVYIRFSRLFAENMLYLLGVSLAPTASPTSLATLPPTSPPTLPPTIRPTSLPTSRPTLLSTHLPTNRPSLLPTNRPTLLSTNRPTLPQTNRPTLLPTNLSPSTPTKPTTFPTKRPTSFPTKRPTSFPTKRPTSFPTKRPTSFPTKRPTNPSPLSPTNRPTSPPTKRPTTLPTNRPTTNRPTLIPTNKLTLTPSSQPTLVPSNQPTTLSPSSQPTLPPTPQVDLSKVTCSDSSALFYNLALNKKTSCTWLKKHHRKIKSLCGVGMPARSVCPSTCKACNPEETNPPPTESPTASPSAASCVDGTGLFNAINVMETCAWLSQQGFQTQLGLCSYGTAAYYYCKKTCNSCSR